MQQNSNIYVSLGSKYTSEKDVKKNYRFFLQENTVKKWSNPWWMFFKINVLKNFTIFTGQQLCWSNFIDKRLSHRCPCEYCIFFKNSFFYSFSAKCYEILVLQGIFHKKSWKKRNFNWMLNENYWPFPVKIYLFKVNKRDTSVSIIGFKQVSVRWVIA